MERIGKDLSLRSIEKQAFFICEKLLGNYEETRLRKTKQRDYKRRNSEIHVQTKDEESVAEVHCHKCRETAIHPGNATNFIAMGAPRRGMTTVLKLPVSSRARAKKWRSRRENPAMRGAQAQPRSRKTGGFDERRPACLQRSTLRRQALLQPREDRWGF